MCHVSVSVAPLRDATPTVHRERDRPLAWTASVRSVRVAGELIHIQPDYTAGCVDHLRRQTVAGPTGRAVDRSVPVCGKLGVK